MTSATVRVTCRPTPLLLSVGFALLALLAAGCAKKGKGTDMAKPAEVAKLSSNVNDLLSDYIKIHEDAFRPSVRRIVPLPGIFEPIDFQARAKEAQEILLGLADCKSQIMQAAAGCNADQREYLRSLSEYVDALTDTVSRLQTILLGLYDRSQRFLASEYDWEEYSRDLAEYETSVETYTSLGKQLNEMHRRLKE